MSETIHTALSGFAAGAPLRDCAETLFGVLGYRSTRTADVGSVTAFLDTFRAGERLTEKQRAGFDSWRTVDIVFQVTGEEIADQSRLFEGEGFAPGVIESFLFLAVDLEGGDYSRTYLADTTRAVNRLFSMPVVVLFRHGATLSLAVVHRRVHKRDTNRDVLEKVTLVKGIRTGRTPHRAHTDILAELALPRLVAAAGVRSFDDLHAAWERTLDVEELNRRFYRELLRWFERAVTECRFPDDGAGDGTAQRHVIRLITRLLFIWFLKEKGLAPDAVFEEDFARGALKQHASDRTDYYRAVLQNLFFATLNTEIGKRAFRKPSASRRRDNPDHRDFSKYRYRALLTDPDGFTETLRSVPFVNGGLFDCLDDFEGTKAGGRRIDAFTDNPAQGRDLHVPARLFFDAEGIFPLFHRYKFTVEENTPLDREVALDPELLGLVFENLLAAYNPETRETARKATGSYYTPRHIVNYMMDETLAAALAENSRPTDGDGTYWRDRLRYLLDYEDAGEFFDSDETQSIIRAIAELRVLDPEIGSGAFPMGVLHKLTLALRRLDPDNTRWEALQKERAATRAGAAFDATDSEAREEELREISRTFDAYRDSDFGRKLYLIQNGIFGVDIQPVACQIAKLRFFISLVIEQRTTADPNDNYGIRPLPNLETRFVAANTLIGLGDKQESVLGSDVIKTVEDELRRVRERYFNARTRETKRRLRKQDDALRATLARKLEALGFGHDNARAVATWDPYNQNAGAAWFDREWMFGLSNSFDIIIGNPPYVESRNSLLSDSLKDSYRDQTLADWGEALPRGSDLLIYFYACAPKFLNGSGSGCFIAQNAWLSTDYGKKFHDFSIGKFYFRRIIDTSDKFFSDVKSQNINTIITIFDHKETEIRYEVANADMEIVLKKTIEALQTLKWGHVFSMPSFYSEILEKMRDGESGGCPIQLGQGLNFPMSKLNEHRAQIPVIVKDASFVATSADGRIQNAGGSKRKSPALVMPRGIGDRHYCILNLCKAFSYSHVELYLPDSMLLSSLHYWLWVYLNSSFVWLFREITGRKNLGGGLLKAEATDMKLLPVRFDFDFANEAKQVLERIRHRKPRSVFEEIYSDEHLFIDEVISEYFGFTDVQENIRKTLVEQVNFRQARVESKTGRK